MEVLPFIWQNYGGTKEAIWGPSYRYRAEELPVLPFKGSMPTTHPSLGTGTALLHPIR